MKLSAHFTLAEMTRSDTAAREGIDNTPTDKEIENLKKLCAAILEPARAHFGKPITPSSGFRCKALNAAVGGSDTSQHMTGQAVDFEVPGVSNIDLAYWIKDNLEFDQLILENFNPEVEGSGWVHVSVTPAPRRSVLTKGPKLYARGLPTR